MARQDHLYFVAIIPPEELSGAVPNIKKTFPERYSSSKALKVIQNITLKAPFPMPVDAEDSVITWFDSIVINQPCFELNLNGFGAFNKKDHPVIFIAPEDNPNLNLLQKTLLDDFRKHFPAITIMHPEWHYKPHITIGYRDLTPENFEKAWQEYESTAYTASFDVTAIHLLQHNRREWNIVQRKNLAIGNR